MNQPKPTSPLQLMAIVAILCSTASVGIVALAFCLLRNISDGGMWAVAAMSASPAILGILIATIINQHAQSVASPRE